MPINMSMVEVPTKSEVDDLVAGLADRIDTLVSVIAERDVKIAALERGLAEIPPPVVVPPPPPPVDLTEITTKLSNQGGRIRDLELWRKAIPVPTTPTAVRSGSRKG